MNYDMLFLLGRILYGGFFTMMGLNHFMKYKEMSGYAASKGVPAPGLASAITGLLLLLGGLGVLLGAHVGWSVLALVLFLGSVSFVMHAFWKVEDPGKKMSEMTNFTKNMALLGGALMLLAISEPWVYSIFS